MLRRLAADDRVALGPGRPLCEDSRPAQELPPRDLTGATVDRYTRRVSMSSAEPTGHRALRRVL